MSNKYLILGHGRHGKDSFAELLCQELPQLNFVSSSIFIAELIFNSKLLDLPEYQSVQDCYDDRANYRQVWYNFIANYNYKDKSKLAKAILAKNDLYVGMRSLEEFKASRSLFTFIFYIDASDRVKYVDPTFHIPYDKRMIKIDNNKKFEDLKAQTKIAAKLIEGRASLNIC